MRSKGSLAKYARSGLVVHWKHWLAHRCDLRNRLGFKSGEESGPLLSGAGSRSGDRLPIGTALDVRTTALQKCAVVPRL